MVTYEQWNKAIISYFFEECEPGQIVFLQTNAETLSEIAELSDFNVPDAVESLKVAVSSKVVVYGAVNLWTVNPYAGRTYSAEEPPQVAFLALTVLAASMMETSDGVLHTNYYVPLNQLLFDEQRKGCPKGIYRPQIEEFWKHLQLWLSYYDVQLYLTEGSSNQRYVWYPKSQCLINNHNRRTIYRFFNDYNLTPFSAIPDNQLKKDLRAWLRSSTGSAKIERYFSNESYQKQILSQVKSLLEHWDGEIPPEPPRGKRQTTASVNVELHFDLFDNVEIRYWFPRRGRHEITCENNPLGIQRLQPSDLEKWFRPTPDENGTFWNLLVPLRFQTNETNPVIYTLSPFDIWVFREDSERHSGWLSQRNMQLYEDHLIVFRKQLTNQVIACLKQTCDPEIELGPSPIDVAGKENDWRYLRVKPIKRLSFSEQELWRLSVVSGKRISLINGLSVKDLSGRRAYLDICLPTVFVPNLGISDQVPLRIDAQTFSVGEDRLITLNNTLEPGVHQLTYGNQTRELRVISPERPLEHRCTTLITSLSPNQATMPTCSIKEIAEISEESGVWLTGAKFFGTDIPEVPWDSVRTAKQIQEADGSQLPNSAELISLVVKTAIDLKQDNASVPEWFDKVIEYLDQNVALRALVQKKLSNYHETAMSYSALRNGEGR